MAINYSVIVRILSFITMLVGFAMIPSALVSLYYHEYSVALNFAGIIVTLIAVGYVTKEVFHTKISKLKHREAYLAVALSWLFASLLGTLPYLLSGAVDNFVDVFFESVSSFTTTGASVLEQIETLPMGIVFWRSFSQWLGGMGILVFAISVLPALGISGQFMAKAETPGINLSKVAPKMSDTAKILYIIYGTFTMLAILIFKLGGLSLFDSMILSMGSVASGGLSNYSQGIAHFNSVYVEFFAALFSVLTCINITLYYSLVKGRIKEALSNTELKVFLSILIGEGLLISMNLRFGSPGQAALVESTGEALRYGLFQSSAFLTTTGHFSSNVDLWPSFSKMLLLTLMIIGASSSSTGGGIKIIRIVLLFKMIRRGLFMRLHPNAVTSIKLQGKSLDDHLTSGVAAFLFLYSFIFALSLLVLSLENFDFLTTVSSVAAALNNVGTGFGLVGTSGSFAVFSGFSKLYLCLLMLVGRLELFTIILLFTPSFWNPDR